MAGRTPTPISNLHLASPKAIRTALSNMKGAFQTRQAWLDAGNKYIGEAVNTLEKDFKDGTVENGQLLEYIATSIPIHCCNGWAYLSSAVNSLLEGDYASAVHNAYYGELRSLMSFLAMQGIGVFGKKHALVDEFGVAHGADTNATTHVFAKNAFDEWLKMPANAAILPKLLIIEGYPLENWMQANPLFQNSSMPNQLAADWLSKWSLDLSILQEETNFRNFVSYRPQSFTLGFTRPSDDITARLRFVKELWTLCAPDGYFSRSILRLSLRQLYQIYEKALADVDVEREWKPLLSGVGLNPDDLNSDYLINFFRGQIMPNDSIVFDRAANFFFTPPIQERDVDPMGIISRATLLLLITTEAVDTMLRQAGLSRSDLQFWFDNIGIKSGYWDPASPPYLFADLWQDIAIELEEVDRWVGDATILRSPFTFSRELRKDIPHIHQVNRAYLWGMD